MKKKIVDEAITGILLAIVTINVFVFFLPRWVATALGLLILCKLLYEYLPAITRKLYETPEGRIFTKKWWIRLLILGLAVPGYFMTFLSEHVYLVLYILVVAVVALGFPLAYAWNKENKGAPPDQQSFWRTQARGQRKNLAEEWEKYKNYPNKLSTFCWYYAPGLILSGMGFCTFVIFLLISWYSQLITVVFVGWILGNILARFKWKSKKPDIEQALFTLLSTLGGYKGSFGFSCIFTGFAFSGTFIAYQFQYSLHFPPNLLDLLGVPPFLYQFVFWYSISRRFPYFLRYWQNGQRCKTLTLPTGQIYAFIGSCISPFYIFIVSASPLFKLLYLSHLHQFYYHLLLSLWFLIDFIFVALIAHTIIKWRREKKSEDLHLDNVRIPLVLFIQSTVLSFGMAYVIEKSFLNELSLISSLLVMVLIILFFVQDWQNFLKHEYGDGLTSEILGILPVFVVLIIANFSIFLWFQPIFYLILTLSIIAVSLTIVDISNNYGMLCYALLHKFHVLLTNEIVKAFNIIKECCNRLFLALHRKEVINKAINGLLLAVVTVNTFVSFLPKYAAITLGALILGKLLYEYLPAITKKLYGDFAEQRWVRLLIVCFAAPGYFMVSYPWDFIIVLMVFFLFLLGFPLGYAWESVNKDVQIPERQFWKVTAKIMNKDLAKEWEEYRTLPNSLTKMILKPIWWYGPGMVLSFLGFFFFMIFLLASIYSLFFTIVFVGWILSNILTKFKYKTDKPPSENDLLPLSLFVGREIKGLNTSTLIIANFAFLGACILQPLSYIFFLLNNPSYYPIIEFYIDYLCILLVLLPFVYLFAFWYAVLKRLPFFIDCWKNGSSGSRGFSLPKGGIYAFIASCFYASNLVQNREELRDLLCLFFTGNNDPGFILSSFLGVSVAHILVISFFSISIVYILGILLTMKKWRKKEMSNGIRKDNIRIPLASLVQLAFFPSMSGKGDLFDFTSLLVIGTFFLIIFFTPDWERFLENRYSNSLTRYILSYILLFIFLLLGLVIIIRLSSVAFYLILALSIIVVFLMFLKYRKKQLSRAKESCTDKNNINQNEEKK